jgi:hypothetical protein
MNMPTATLKNSIGRRLRAVTLHHRANWRQWATDMAAGKNEPSAADVVEAALHLGIADPAERLEADAQVIREVVDAERTIALCEADRAVTLQPYDGSLEKLREAVAAAKAAYDRLAAIERPFNEWPVEWHQRSTADRLRRSRPDLFPEEPSR